MYRYIYCINEFRSLAGAGQNASPRRATVLERHDSRIYGSKLIHISNELESEGKQCSKSGAHTYLAFLWLLQERLEGDVNLEFTASQYTAIDQQPHISNELTA